MFSAKKKKKKKTKKKEKIVAIADEVAEWSNRNRVKLNIDKCKELRISFA